MLCICMLLLNEKSNFIATCVYAVHEWVHRKKGMNTERSSCIQAERICISAASHAEGTESIALPLPALLKRALGQNSHPIYKLLAVRNH